jgi:hypothetical protein
MMLDAGLTRSADAVSVGSRIGKEANSEQCCPCRVTGTAHI